MVKRALAPLLAMAIAGCGGDGWDELEDGPAMFSFNAVWAFSPRDVWIGGTPTLEQPVGLAHFDGDGWSLADNPTGVVSGIWAFGADDIWAVGGANVYHRANGEWTTTSLDTIGAHDLLDIWGSTASDLWAVGDGFFHWDGSAWERVDTGDAEGIWGAASDRIWAVGTFDFYQYDGSSWSTFDLDLWGGEGDAWGFGPADVWLAASSEGLAHWDGSAWDIHDNENIFGDLTTVWGAGSNDVWAAGSFGQIAHWDGSAWESVTRQEMGSPYLKQYHAIHGSSANEVWVVGQVLGAEGNHGIIARRSK